MMRKSQQKNNPFRQVILRVLDEESSAAAEPSEQPAVKTNGEARALLQPKKAPWTGEDAKVWKRKYPRK